MLSVENHAHSRTISRGDVTAAANLVEVHQVPRGGFSLRLLAQMSFGLAFICPQEISPERPKIPAVARHDRCRKLAAIEHGGHRAGEASSILVMEESYKKCGLPIAHHDT